MIEYVIAGRFSYGYEIRIALCLVLTYDTKIGKDGEDSPPAKPG